jgi:predicted transcriptional regulator
MDAVEPITEDHFAEMLPAMQEMLGHTKQTVMAEYINQAHAEFTSIINKLEVHNAVTAFNIKNLEKVQLLPLHMKKAHDFGIYKEYMDTTESMVSEVFKVLAYAEELSQVDPSEDNLTLVKNIQNDIIYRFDKRSSEIIENLRYNGLERVTKQMTQILH